MIRTYEYDATYAIVSTLPYLVSNKDNNRLCILYFIFVIIVFIIIVTDTSLKTSQA